MKQGLLRLTLFLSFLALLLGTWQTAFAQTETGQIHGAVTDQSGAVVPKAKVTLKSMSTGAERVLETDDLGLYAATNLLPGTYSVRVEAPSLAKKEARAEVFVGKAIELNIQLTVGATATVVEVIGESGMQVNTESQTLGATFDNKAIETLPTLNRDPYANTGNVGTASDSDPSGRGVGFSFNGLRSASTNILLDGSANNNEFTATVGQPIPLESVQELSVLTNNFTAEYGRASSAVVNVATKNGTNDFHGSAYEYNRVSALSSNSFFNNANSIAKPTFVRNQFGGSVGGPVKRNKIFFFGNAEWNRIRSSTNRTRWVVDPSFVARADAKTTGFYSQFGKLRSGIQQGPTATLNRVLGAACPAGGTLAYGLPTPTNTVSCDATFMDQVSYSVPADAGAGSPQNQELVVGRVDWNVSEKTTIYTRYALNRSNLFSGTVSDSAYAGYDTAEKVTQNNILVSMTHSFSTRLTSQQKLVFNRLNDFQPLGTQPISPGLYVSPATGATFQGRNIVLPGYLPTTPGNGIPFGGPQNFVQVYEDWSFVKGRHSIRWGGSYDYQRDNRTFGAYETPVASFRTSGSAWTSAAVRNFLNGQLAQFQGAINPQGHFPCPFPITAGQPCTNPANGQLFDQGNVTTPVNQPVFARSNRYHEFAFYGSDQWKLTNHLTLNLGLRWEYFGIQHNKNSRLDSNFYFGSGGSIFDQIRSGGVAITPDSALGGLWKKDWNNFGPKLGFAYDFFGNGKTVLRGGYSIAYERNFGNVTFNVIQNPPNYSVISIQNGVDVPANSLPVTTSPAGPLAGSGTVKAIPKVSLRAVNPNIATSYAHLMSLSVEHEIRHNLVAGIDYSGSFGEKLYDIANINRTGSGNVYEGDPAALGLTRLKMVQYSNVNYRNDAGKSHYNALVARLGMRNWANTGLTLDANYTWAHTLDELSDTFSSSGNQFNLGYLDPFNPKVDYGNSYIDIRHRFTAQAIWEVPFGKHTTGWQKQVASGWTISPVLLFETGSPFSIFDCTWAFFTVCPYAVNAGAGLSRSAPGSLQPSGTADNFIYIPFLDGSGNQLFDNAAPFNATTGTSEFGPWPAAMNARNAFRGPGYWNISVAAEKSFAIRERMKLKLRGEAYNVFNHANLFVVGGDADVSAGTFLDAYKDGNRTMQLAIRFEF